MPQSPVALSIATLVAGLGLTTASARPPEDQRAQVARPPLLARVEVLHVLFAAQQSLVADAYWVRAAEAMGRARDAQTYKNVYFYVKQVVDLDPNFAYAYVFGATAVTYNLGRERWVNTEESTELLRRVVARFPQHIYARTLLAYNLSQYHREFRQAADLLADTAKMPGAPAHLAPLAARLYARGGDIGAGVEFARALEENADDPHTRDVMARRRKELELERILERVDAAADEFARREGHRPRSVDALRARGYDLGDLTDPLGGQIILDAQDRAVSTASSDRMIIYGLDEGHK